MFGYENAVRVLFTDRCSVFVREKTLRDDGVTVFSERCLASDLPCRLSYDTYPAAKQNNRTAHTTGGAVLFLPSGTLVPPGSSFEAERDGRTVRLKASGIPKLYPGHMEITVKPAETEA